MRLSVHKLDTIVITGAGRGIGKAAALDFAKTGATILCISQSANAAETAKRIGAAGGLADSIEVDIGDYRAAEAAVSAWIAKSGAQRIGTVLAAAVLGGTGPLIDTDLSTWDLA